MDAVEPRTRLTWMNYVVAFIYLAILLSPLIFIVFIALNCCNPG